MSIEHLPDDARLIALAGKAAFQRGSGYHDEGRITLTSVDGDGFKGNAEGSTRYTLWLKRAGNDWRWDCTCPAADDGAFCKHLVAAVLTARVCDGDDNDDGSAVGKPRRPQSGSRRAPPRKSDDLAGFLRAQTAERLADWLLTLADDDPAIAKRLQLHRSADDPVALKSALARMLDTGGFLDYRRSLAYAHQLDAGIEQLAGLVGRDPDAARRLCEYAGGRLLKIIERADDSAGAIGDRMAAIAELHARACAAAPPGKAFAKALLALQMKDQWDLFPLDAYWKALGADGQADYGKRVLAEFGALPEKSSGNDRLGATFYLLRRVEAYARASDDFALLQRVLRRDLSYPRDYLRVLESLHAAGRTREALEWAEQAVKRFPKDTGLRVALSERLVEAGLDDEAVEHLWEAYRNSSTTDSWDRLKQHTGQQWPTWRARALDHIAGIEREQAGHRITLLMHDGDIDAAIALAREHKARIDVLEQLARRIEHDQSATAGEFYLRIAETIASDLQPSLYERLTATMKRAKRCAPIERWTVLLTGIRNEHRRKSKLMTLFDKAGF